MKEWKSIYVSMLCLGGIFLCALPLEAQRKVALSRASLDSLLNPTLLDDGGKVLLFDSCRKNIGMLAECDTPRVCHFRFRNVSGKEVRITRVTTSCGCMAAGYANQPVAPGEEGTVALTYYPKNHPGTIDTHAFVYTALSDKHPVARLSLAGYVASSDEWDYLPYSSGALKLKRKQVLFSEVSPSQQPSERILCANTGTTPLRLSASLLPDYATFHTEPEVLLPGEEGDIVIIVCGSRLPQQPSAGKLEFPLLIEGTGGRPSERMLRVTVYPGAQP